MQQLIAATVAAIEGGRHADALHMSRELVRSLPGNEGALSLLAVSEQNAGNLATARGLLETLIRDHPDTWQHWNNLGNVRRLLGELAPAAEAYARALRLNSGSARLQANLGLLHLNLGDFERARERLCAASKMEGAQPGMSIWAAVACFACADDDAARAEIKAWRRWPRPSDEAMLELGWLLFQLGDAADGEAVLSGEFHDETCRQRALARRVLALERINRIDEANVLLQRLPDVQWIADPQARMEALHALAIVAMRQKDCAAALAHYAAALALDLPRRYQVPLYFGLARACHELGDIPATMDALARAHGSDSSEAVADREELAGLGLLSLGDPRLAFDDSLDRDGDDSPPASCSPVFVVGFPRSGTTLLEQMLAAHGDFASVDEQPFVQRMIESVRQRGLCYPADLRTLTVSDTQAIRALYWQHAAQFFALEPGVRLVDKQPFNFLALPMIRQVFANAAVVFCMRHPCDVILSCYMQQFRDPQLAAMCVSIERLAHEYVRLMQRWLHDSRLFPDNIIVCRHEDLVADVDSQLRNLCEFLGVDNASAMRGFSEHARARGFIGTPSYAQVVQPLNRDGVGRWQRYRTYFEPVLPILAPIMDYWGYDA